MIAHLALLAVLQQQAPPQGPDQSYLFFVASEGTDEVALVRFGPKGLLVEHRTPIRLVPGDPATPSVIYSPRYQMFDSLAPERTISLSSAHGFASSALATGPRNLAVSRDGGTYYVTTANGMPGGEVVKVRIAADSGWRRQMATDSVKVFQPPDTVQSGEPVTGAPGALQITPDGAYAWISSAAVPGDAELPGISVVYLASMIEVLRIPTCAAPAGSRLTADGSRHYSVCADDDEVIEIDARAMKVTRRLTVTPDGRPRCRPGAVAVAPDGSQIFVACRQSGDVVEIDTQRWSVSRRFPVASGLGDLAVSADGRRLVCINPVAGTVSVIDLGGGPVSVVSTRRQMPSAVTISPDSRYAFVSVAGSASEPGSIEVIDLDARALVASLDFGRRLAGIAFWKVDR